MWAAGEIARDISSAGPASLVVRRTFFSQSTDLSPMEADNANVWFDPRTKTLYAMLATQSPYEVAGGTVRVAIVDTPEGTPSQLQTCITSALSFQGKHIRTVEAHAPRDAAGDVEMLSPVQEAFAKHFSFQCGYCTPGFVNAATVLLERLARHPIARHELESAIAGELGAHICRCTGYVRYYEAVRDLIESTPGLLREA